jgi:hypothetical protein
VALAPDDLTAPAVEELLSSRHPGVRVADVRVASVDELTNAHVRLEVAYDEPAGAPTSLFCKLPPLQAERRAVINATGMGLREARFYDDLAPHLALRTPEVHGTSVDEASGDFVVLLEDLRSTGCTVSDGTIGVSPDAAAVALRELAELHVRFAHPQRRQADAPWVLPAGPGSDYAVGMLRYGIEHHRDRLRDAFVELAELYCERRLDLQALWHAGPQTVVHGDPHLGNVFDDHGRTGFLDWGIVMVSTPMRDVSYFLTMAMDVEDRRAHEADLLREYLAAAGDPFPFDEAWRAHRIQAAYTVPASCQVVTFPDDVTEARRIFADAFLERSMAAVEELESASALREAWA